MQNVTKVIAFSLPTMEQFISQERLKVNWVLKVSTTTKLQNLYRMLF